MERELKVYRGCKNDGIVQAHHNCGDPECMPCNGFAQQFDAIMREKVDDLFNYKELDMSKGIMSHIKPGTYSKEELTIEKLSELLNKMYK